jgi:hypothetical protein
MASSSNSSSKTVVFSFSCPETISSSVLPSIEESIVSSVEVTSSFSQLVNEKIMAKARR